MLRRDEQRGEPARAPAHQRDARRVAPAFLHGVADARGDVGDVALAPPPGERLRVRAPVAGRAAVVGLQHGPAPLRRTTARARSSRRVAWPVGPPCTWTSSGGLRGRGRRRPPQQPVHGRAARLPRDRPRLDQRGRARTRRPARARSVRRPEPFAASTTTWPGVTAPERTHTMPAVAPVEAAVPTLRQLTRRTCAPGARDHEPAEAVLVAAPRELRRRRATTRTTAGPDPTPAPRARAARAAPAARSPPSGSAVHTTGQPSASQTNASAIAVGREPRLADADRVAAGDDLRRAAVVAHDDPRRVPRHVRAGPTRATRARVPSGDHAGSHA